MTLRIGSPWSSLLVGLCLSLIPAVTSAQPAQPPPDQPPTDQPPAEQPAADQPAAQPPPAPSAVGDDSTRVEAKARYERGLELYFEENFRGALVEFKRSHELTNEYRVLYNVAQVCYQLQDYVCALTSFERYLRDGGAEISDERRRTVQAEIEKLRPRIATITFEANVPGASLSIDDVPSGKTPHDPILISAGAHRITLTKEGFLPLSQTIAVAGAEKRTIRLELVRAGESRVVVREKSGPESQWTTLSYVGLGVGGALIIGAGVTGAMALSSSSKMEKEQYVGAPSSAATDLQSDVETYRLTSDILAGAGILTLGTTLILTLTRDVETEQPAPPPAVSMAFGPGSASVVGSF